MKCVAYIKQVVDAIHRVAELHDDGAIQALADLAAPQRIELELEGRSRRTLHDVLIH